MEKKWWHGLIGYQIYPKSFQDSNGDGTGDIPGILSRLDYIEKMGISLLWICPVFQSPMVDNGYDISDYEKIDPMFGSREDLKRLVDEAKKRGITVILDLVINHTSDRHPWFQEALRDPEGKYGKYYIIRKGKNGQPPNRWRSLFGGSAWEPIGESGYYYLHLFTVGQPDLNWENAELRRELYRMINGWLELGIGGFRIDAIAHIKKNLDGPELPADGPDGLYSAMPYFRNVEGIEDWLRELKENTFQKYDCFTLAEVDDIPEERMEAYIGEDGYYSTVFDFCHCHHNLQNPEWENRGSAMLADIRRLVFERQLRMNGKGFFCNYQENHDMIRIPDRFLAKQDQNFYSLSMLPVLYFFLAGVPMLYQGQEIGMTDFPRQSIGEYLDLATHNSYRELLQKGLTEAEALDRINRTCREHSRTPMQWSGEKYAGFSTVEPWFAVPPGYRDCNVERQENREDSLLSFFRRVTALRSRAEYRDTWIYGDFEPLEQGTDSLWAFARSLKGQRLCVLANLTGQEVQTGQPCSGRVLLNNYDGTEQAGGKLLLKPWQAVVMENGKGNAKETRE